MRVHGLAAVEPEGVEGDHENVVEEVRDVLAVLEAFEVEVEPGARAVLSSMATFGSSSARPVNSTCLCQSVKLYSIIWTSKLATCLTLHLVHIPNFLTFQC